MHFCDSKFGDYRFFKIEQTGETCHLIYQSENIFETFELSKHEVSRDVFYYSIKLDDRTLSLSTNPIRIYVNLFDKELKNPTFPNTSTIAQRSDIENWPKISFLGCTATDAKNILDNYLLNNTQLKKTEATSFNRQNLNFSELGSSSDLFMSIASSLISLENLSHEATKQPKISLKRTRTTGKEDSDDTTDAKRKTLMGNNTSTSTTTNNDSAKKDLNYIIISIKDDPTILQQEHWRNIFFKQLTESNNIFAQKFVDAFGGKEGFLTLDNVINFGFTINLLHTRRLIDINTILPANDIISAPHTIIQEVFTLSDWVNLYTHFLDLNPISLDWIASGHSPAQAVSTERQTCLNPGSINWLVNEHPTTQAISAERPTLIMNTGWKKRREIIPNTTPLNNPALLPSAMLSTPSRIVSNNQQSEKQL